MQSFWLSGNLEILRNLGMSELGECMGYTMLMASLSSNPLLGQRHPNFMYIHSRYV